MYQITSRQALNLVRARTRRRTDLDRLGEAAGLAPSARVHPSPDPAVTLRLREQQRTLESALTALPTGLRVCWVLKEHHGLSYAEIGTALDLPVSTVRGRIHRARRQLAAALAPWRDELTSSTLRQVRQTGAAA